MKDFKSAKVSIDTNITANGTQSITGEKLNSVLTEMIEAAESEVGKKQNSILDLDTIRTGAAKGATALQEVPAGYVTVEYVNNAIALAITNTLNTAV